MSARCWRPTRPCRSATCCWTSGGWPRSRRALRRRGRRLRARAREVPRRRQPARRLRIRRGSGAPRRRAHVRRPQRERLPARAAAVPAGLPAVLHAPELDRCSGRSRTTAGSPACRCSPAVRRRSTGSSAGRSPARGWSAYAPERSATARVPRRRRARDRLRQGPLATAPSASRTPRRPRPRRADDPRPAGAARAGRLARRRRARARAARRAAARRARPRRARPRCARLGAGARRPARRPPAARARFNRLDPEPPRAGRRRDRAAPGRTPRAPPPSCSRAARARRRRAGAAGPPPRRRQPAQRALDGRRVALLDLEHAAAGPAAADLGLVLAGLLLARVQGRARPRPSGRARRRAARRLRRRSRPRPPPRCAGTPPPRCWRACALPAVNRVRPQALRRLRDAAARGAGAARMTPPRAALLLPALGRARAPDALVRAVRGADRALPRRAAVRRRGARRDPAARGRRARRAAAARRRRGRAASSATTRATRVEQAWAARAGADPRDLPRRPPRGRARRAVPVRPREVRARAGAAARGGARGRRADGVQPARHPRQPRANQQAHDDRAAALADAHLDAVLVHSDPRSRGWRRRSRRRAPLARARPLHRASSCATPRRPARAARQQSSSRPAAGSSASRCCAPRSSAAAPRPARRCGWSPARCCPTPRGERLRAAGARPGDRAACARSPTSARSCARAAASVSQGGYNTALEVVRARRARRSSSPTRRRGGRADAPRAPARAARRAARARPERLDPAALAREIGRLLAFAPRPATSTSTARASHRAHARRAAAAPRSTA